MGINDRLIKARTAKKPDTSGFHRPEGAGNFDNMDDMNIVNQVNTLTGKVEHIPTDNKHIVNKEYADRHDPFWNGSFKETFDALVTSNGTIVTMTLTNADSGNLTMQFSTGESTLSMPDTIALTVGSDASPQANYIYIPLSTKVLTKSTSNWPNEEHIKIGYFLIQSASGVQSDDGCYINQNWNDHLAGTNDMGHAQHLAEALRRRSARYFSGIDGNGTDNYLTPTASNVEFKSTAGVVYQLHQHTFPAVDTSTSSDVHVKNWNGDSFHQITNLFDIVNDSTGSAISNNKYFNLVFWGVANKTGEHDIIMVNLPSGSYNTQAGAESDTSGFDDFSMPREFNFESSTGFLLSRMTIQMGTTWSVASSVDLRGQSPTTASGGASSVATEFPDNTFRIFDEADPTKELALSVGGISASTTRTITVPDESGTIPLKTGTPISGQMASWSSETTLQPEAEITYDGSIFQVANTAAAESGMRLKSISGQQAVLYLDNTTDIWAMYAPASSNDLRFWNGSDLMTIDSSGNVGIGTASPNTAKLHVIGSPTQINFNDAVDKGGFLVSLNDDQAIVSAGAYFDGGNWKATDTTVSQIEMVDGQIRFRYKTGLTAGDTVSWSDSMRILSDGKVGIGTVSPSARFHVKSTGATSQTFGLFEDSAGTDAVKMWSDVNGDSLISIYDTSGNEDVRLYSAGNSWFRDTNLGLGTTAPAEKLEIEGGNLKMESTNDGNNGLIRFYDANDVESGQVYASASDLRLFSANDIIMTADTVDVVGAIASGTTTISASSDAVDVTGVNTIFVNTGSGDVTIGGFTGGIDGQVVHIIKAPDSSNNMILEYNEAAGTEKLLNHAQVDLTFDKLGGATYVFGVQSKWWQVDGP